MKLVFQYLKPFRLALIFSIIFLFVQVLSDLGLPRLMSSMVDVGIQGKGIAPEAAQAMSEEGFALLQMFSSRQDAEALKQAYKLVLAGTDEAMNAASQFPALTASNAYVLKEQNKAQQKEVDSAYVRAANALTLYLKEEGGNINLEPASLYSMLPHLAEQKTEQSLEPFISMAASNEGTAGSQAAVALTSMLYRELAVDLNEHQQAYIFRIGLQMLGVALLGSVAAIFVGWYAAKIGTGVAKRLRRDVFEKVGRFSSAEFERFSTASLITRTTNDIQQIQQLILLGIRLIIFAPIMGIGSIILAIRSSVSMSWIIAVAIIAIVGIILLLFALAIPKFKVLQRLVDKLNLVSRESLSGMMVIRAFGNEQYEEQRFQRANDDLRKTNRFVQRTMAFLFPAITLVMNFVTLLVIWVGAKEIAASSLQIGDMLAFMQYAGLIIMAFLLMSMMIMMIPRALVAAERIQEVLRTELTIRDADQPLSLNQAKGVTLCFDEVSFRYSNAEENILDKISFTAKPGETIAFIGTTGAGKSTLLNLIPRLHDVTEGRITVNDIDIRELPQQELREMIGYVPQKGFLFSGDIKSNVQYGNASADEEQINKVLEVAQAKSFIEQWEHGIESPISQGGRNVSGGQRQRLAIARALLKHAPVYLFDDSFSALDVKTDAALRKALRQFTTNATVLVVAQRVSTIKDADQIIVLDKGRIVSKGTHSELLAHCPTYREIAESQLTREELA